MSNPKHSLRGAWIATVNNLDWPSKCSLKIKARGERIAVQKEELVR